MARNVPIIVLLAAFLALATVYSGAIPLGEGPDEPGHVAYALFLARAGRLPVQRLDTSQADVPGEGHQPPLAYALAAPLALWLPPEQRQADTIGNPRFTWSGGAEVNAISHGSREYPPWQGAVLAWHLMRLASAALGAATVFFSYLAAREINCRLQIADCRLGAGQSAIYNLQSATPLLAAGVVAFNPQFLFVSALVTNDALLIALSAVLIWLVARSEERRGGAAEARARGGIFQAYSSAVALGIVLGLALLTKQSAIVLIPIALIGVVPREQNGRRDLRRLLASAGLLLATAALIAGWWYARNLRLYGDLFGLAAFRGEFATQPFQISSPAAWAAALAQLHASFWARFGWMNVAPPAWTLWLIAAIELAALAGLAREWRRAGRRGWGVWPPKYGLDLWMLVLLPALAFAWVISFAITAGLVAWQGRLLFPALPAIAILLARGLLAWCVGTKDHPQGTAIEMKRSSFVLRPSSFVLAAVLCLLLLLALWMPGKVIRPAYPPQTLPPSVAQQRLANATIVRFRRRGERSVALRGWQIDGPPRAGATMRLSLMWYASARQVRDWVVFVHLVDRQGRVVAEANSQPRGGAFPTSQWNMGDWVEDQHELRLPAGLAAGAYTLRMGLYDPSQQNRRAGVYKLGGDLIGDTLDLGSIIVADGG